MIKFEELKRPEIYIIPVKGLKGETFRIVENDVYKGQYCITKHQWFGEHTYTGVGEGWHTSNCIDTKLFNTIQDALNNFNEKILPTINR